MAEASTLSAADIRAMNPQEVVTELARRDLDLSGNDGQLRSRLMAALGLSAGSKSSKRPRHRKKKPTEDTRPSPPASEAPTNDDVEIVYTSSVRAKDLSGTQYAELADVLSKFYSAEVVTGQEEPEVPEVKSGEGAVPEEEVDEPEDEEAGGLSNRQRRVIRRLTLAELKARVNHPEVLEPHDTAAEDPTLLGFLKGYIHSVPVPVHWNQKRRYLSGRRALDKVTYQLPKFIRDTGIAEARDRALEEDAKKSLRQKMREKVRPKLGRVAVDYEILYDAFFKHQEPPPLSNHGELYYEGREHEKDRSHMRPGVISARLREAIGLAPGHPPPWLVQMQRYGPPPSYPAMRVPGLNAPIPEGASFGYQPGGWGMPPVDDYGRPLYGNPFAKEVEADASRQTRPREKELGVPKHLAIPHSWGEVNSDDEEEDLVEAEPVHQLPPPEPVGSVSPPPSSSAPAPPTPAEAPSAQLAHPMAVAEAAASAVPSGPLQLKKEVLPVAMDPSAPKSLYTVLEQAKEGDSGGIMGAGAHKYVIPAGGEAAPAATAGVPEGARPGKRSRAAAAANAISIDPSELEGLDAEGIERLLLQKRAQSRDTTHRAEIDSMLQEHQRIQAARKRKKEKKDNEYF
jgi:splicing factor 3B subunit 2